MQSADLRGKVSIYFCADYLSVEAVVTWPQCLKRSMVVDIL